MIIKVGRRCLETRQLRSPFIQRELAGQNEEVKQPHRDRVAEFFARYQSPLHKPRCFCLPGIRWSFERTLDRELKGKCSFIGVERNYTVLETGLREIPGRHQIYIEEPTNFDQPLRGYATNRSTVFWCDASHFLDCGRPWKRTKKQARAWARRYKDWTCAWLDFSGPLGPEITVAAKRIENHLRPEMPTAPVAVTFMLGRELPETTEVIQMFSRGGGALDDRVRYLQVCWESSRWRTVEIRDSWSYQSAGGCPMGMVTALFHLKTPTGVRSVGEDHADAGNDSLADADGPQRSGGVDG